MRAFRWDKKNALLLLHPGARRRSQKQRSSWKLRSFSKTLRSALFFVFILGDFILSSPPPALLCFTTIRGYEAGSYIYIYLAPRITARFLAQAPFSAPPTCRHSSLPNLLLPRGAGRLMAPNCLSYLAPSHSSVSDGMVHVYEVHVQTVWRTAHHRLRINLEVVCFRQTAYAMNYTTTKPRMLLIDAIAAFFLFFLFNDELRRAAARGAPMEVGLGRGGVGAGPYRALSPSTDLCSRFDARMCRCNSRIHVYSRT